MCKLSKVILITLIFSVVTFSGCKKNKPDIPSTPTGPTIGIINTEYSFTSSAEDPNGDSVAIRFDWGDGDTSNWSNWAASGDSISMSHSWVYPSDSCGIRAQAKDKSEITSNWSKEHLIQIILPYWTKIFGGSVQDYGYSVQQTSDGGYIITGCTYSYGAGSADVYLIKTDVGGNQQWFNTFGGSEVDIGYSVRQTLDGGYILTGITYSYGAGWGDVYLIKTDDSGNQQWFKTFGDTFSDVGHSVLTTNDGGYLIVGTLQSPEEGQQVCLIKTDATGNQQWSKTFGGQNTEEGYSVQPTTDGGFIITGNTCSYGAGGYDVYLIKTDNNGNQQWYKTFGGSGSDYAFSVEQTSDGGYIVAGSCLIKTNPIGDTIWTKPFGGNSVQQTSDGGYIVAGTSDGDVCLIKTDESGNQQWYKTIGISNEEEGNSVQQTSDGGYIIVGSSYSPGVNGEEVYLIKTDANGNTYR